MRNINAIMLDLFQHPFCPTRQPVIDARWTLKRVQGDKLFGRNDNFIAEVAT